MCSQTPVAGVANISSTSSASTLASETAFITGGGLKWGAGFQTGFPHFNIRFNTRETRYTSGWWTGYKIYLSHFYCLFLVITRKW